MVSMDDKYRSRRKIGGPGHVEITSTKIFYGVVRSLRGTSLQQRIHKKQRNFCREE